MSRRDEVLSALRVLADASGETIAIEGVGPARPDIPAAFAPYYVNGVFSLRAVEETFGFEIDPSDRDAYQSGRLSFAEIIDRMNRRK